ncbi:MAG: response regulator [Firmicutes bacterium]|nr:response regulator [Bacillota bacterium]
MARILVIDDSPLFRLLLTEILTKNGNECYDASTNSEGMEIFLQEPLDLVIKDLIMEDADPIEVIKQLKRQKPEVKIVICSTATQKSLIYQAIRAGAQDFLLKPFNTEEVIKTVNRLLAN